MFVYFKNKTKQKNDLKRGFNVITVCIGGGKYTIKHN